MNRNTDYINYRLTRAFETFDEEIVQPLIYQTKNFIDDIVSLASSN
jgi:hypothetical protein